MDNKVNESSKDMLFSRLLPALKSNPFSSEYEGVIRREMETEVEVSEDDILAALRSKLFAREDEGSGKSAYATLNIMESLVVKYLDQVIKRFNSCSCDRCKCDIAAYALNNLPPKYVVADKEKGLKLEEEISSKLIMSALINAVIKVRSEPRH